MCSTWRNSVACVFWWCEFIQQSWVCEFSINHSVWLFDMLYARRICWWYKSSFSINFNQTFNWNSTFSDYSARFFFYYYVHDIARVHLTEEQTFHIFFYHSSRSKNFKITFFQSIPFKSIKLANAEEFSNRYRKKKVYLLFQSRSLMNFLVNCWVGIKSRRKKGRKSNLQSTSSHYTSISLHLILFCQYWRIAILALSLTPLSLPHSFIVPLTALKMKFK